MSPEERQLLTALFERVRTASATPRDEDAEALIDQGNARATVCHSVIWRRL